MSGAPNCVTPMRPEDFKEKHGHDAPTRKTIPYSEFEANPEYWGDVFAVALFEVIADKAKSN